jgi:hypothetical protein
MSPGFRWKHSILLQLLLQLSGLLLVCGWSLIGNPAWADESLLNFDSSVSPQSPSTPDYVNHSASNPVTPAQDRSIQNKQEIESVAVTKPLAIPDDAIEPPVGKSNESQMLLLPPKSSQPGTTLGPPDRYPAIQLAYSKSPTFSDPVVLSFDAPELGSTDMGRSPRSPLTPKANHGSPSDYFHGATDQPLETTLSASLLARTIGATEGTRTLEGYPTAAYYGHVDPGNGVWNLGSFSYQHGAKSPEEADRKQLQRLTQQAHALLQDASTQTLSLTVEELLNGIDLANQAPLAALGSQGYIDRLKQARNMGLDGEDAILWARTRSFLDPDTQRWNAPGLGNTIDIISQDQARRQRAIAQVLSKLPDLSADLIVFLPQVEINQESSQGPSDVIIDQILNIDLEIQDDSRSSSSN